MNSIKKYINSDKKLPLSLFLFLFVITSTTAQISFYGDPIPIKELNTSKNEDFLALDRFNHRLLFTRDFGLNSEGNRRSIILTVTDNDAIKIYANDQLLTSAGSSLVKDQVLINETHFERGRYYSELVIKDKIQPDMVLEISNLDNLAPSQSGHISVDGKFLLISAQKKNGYGVEDIYVSKNENGNWSPLESLGYFINTEFQEISPFLAADNKTLFFASNRKGGFGSMDLYMSQRLDEGWRQWSDPVNLGASVNTSGSETSLVFFEEDDFAYFVSTMNSDGYGDIKKIRIKAEIEAVAIDSAEITPQEVSLTNSISFLLKDAKSNVTIVGRGFYLVESDTVNLVAKDDYLILDQLKVGEQVNIEFKSSGYLSESMSISYADLDTTINVVEVMLEPLSKGNVITLKNVLFYRGTANFIEGSQSELDLVVEMLNENADVTILLKGHTDNVGHERLNTKLSEQRVLAVKNYLVDKGIATGRIDGKGFGGSQPKYSNEQEKTRKLNRRVEFEIIRD